MTKEKNATIRKYLALHFPHQMVVSVKTVCREYDTLVENFGLPLFECSLIGDLGWITERVYSKRWGCIDNPMEPDPITLYFTNDSDAVHAKLLIG
jgi:hypothetical protein